MTNALPASTEVLRHEQRGIRARLNEIQGSNPPRMMSLHPVHGEEISRLNTRNVEIMRALIAAEA